jgi:hypothetical protein
MTEADAVVAAYVHGNEVAASWHHAILEVLADDLAGDQRLYRGGWIAMHAGTNGLTEARNETARTFLAEHRADWLWLTDTDMGFAPDTLTRLMEAADPVERPIVGALCFSQREIEGDGKGGYRTAATPTIYDWATIDGRQGFAVRWDYARDDVVRCGGTGMACILIHRSVFEKIEDAHGPVWYDRVPNTSTGQLLGEDLSFCLRAGALNIPVHIHTGVKCTHLKPIWLAEGDYMTQRVAEAVRTSKPEAAESVLVGDGPAA